MTQIGRMNDNPYHIHGQNRPSRWLISSDHASNHVPSWVNGGDLGLPSADMQRHIAFDPGAAGVALALGEALDGPVILSNFSRLVIDPNRGEDDPTLVMKLYDGTIIPANRHADDAEIEKRLTRLHRPYHNAYQTLADEHPNRVIASVHSFTPQMRDRPPRPWQIGVLYSRLDTRLALPFIDRLRAENDLSVGDNQPYYGHFPGDALERHAFTPGRPNILIEIRNDLIQTDADQRAWAQRLAPMMQDVLAASNL